MAIAFEGQLGGGSYTGTNLTATISGATAGNTLVVDMFIRAPSPVTYTDNTGNWTQRNDGDNGHTERHEVWTRIATGTSADDIDFTMSESRSNTWQLSEFSGLADPTVMNGTVIATSANSDGVTGHSHTFTPGDADDTGLISILTVAGTGRWGDELADFSIDNSFTGPHSPGAGSGFSNFNSWGMMASRSYSSTSSITPKWTGVNSGTNVFNGMLTMGLDEASATVIDMTAVAAMIFGSSASATAVGTISGTGAMVFGSAASLAAAAANDISATSALSFGSSASINSLGSLEATGTISFGSAADLGGVGSVEAVGALVFGSAADLDAPSANDVSAVAALAFAGSATPGAIGTVAAASSIAFGSSASIEGEALLAASAALAFGSAAGLNASGILEATAPMAFGSSASLDGVIEGLNAVASVSFGSAASLVAVGRLEAVASLTFTTFADLRRPAVFSQALVDATWYVDGVGQTAWKPSPVADWYINDEDTWRVQ